MRLNAHESQGLPSTLDYRLDIVGIRTDIWTQVSFSETGLAKIRTYAEQNPTYSSEMISGDLFPELKRYYDTFQNSSYQIHRLTGREYEHSKPAVTKQRLIKALCPSMETRVPELTGRDYEHSKPAVASMETSVPEATYNPICGAV